MADFFEKTCPQCGQHLRFPKNVGGIVMACPSCGQKFHSDFKIKGTSNVSSCSAIVAIFEMPSTLLHHIRRFFSAR